MTAKPAPGCAGCRFVDKEGKRRGPWRCTVPVVMPALPDSITASMSYQDPSALRRNGRWAGDGINCPTRET